MITHELLRELLQDSLNDIQDIAEWVPNEIVYRALIIREYMKDHGITDPREGLRAFHAYERDRISKLGLMRLEPAEA